MSLQVSRLHAVALIGAAALVLAACGSAPSSSRTLRSAADALNARQWTESATLFQQARAEAGTEEDRSRAQYGLAEVALQQGRPDEALAGFRPIAETTTIPPQLRLGSQLGVGRSLRALGRKDEAKAALETFFTRLHQLTDVERLHLRTEDIVVPSMSKLEAQAGYNLGVTNYELGQLEPAAAALEPIVAALSPGLEQAQAYRILAHARQAAGQLDEAAQQLGRAYVVSPPEPVELRCDLLIAQADVYSQMTKTVPAVEALIRAAELCPAKTESMERAQALMATLSPQDLEDLARRYPHESPGDLASIYLARSLADSGELRGAIDRLRQAMTDYAGSALSAQLDQEIVSLEQRLVVDPRAIGFLGPMSGRLSQVGKEILSGAQLAVDEFNKLHPDDAFKLVVKDVSGGTELEQSALTTLVQDQKVVAIIGPITTASVQACADKIEELGVPTVTPSATGEGLPGTRKFLFRGGMLQSQQIRRIVDFAARSLQLRTFAILFPETRYGSTIRAEFEDAVKTYGGVVVAEASYAENAADFGAPILQIKAAQPEAIFLPGPAETVAQIATQLPFHDLTGAALLGTSALSAEVDKLIEIGEEKVDGLYFVDDYFEGSSDPLTRAFVESFRLKYGRAPSRLAAQGFDSARLLILKIREDGNRANRALLARRLSSTSNFQSVTGLTGFGPGGEAVKELKVLGISGGHIVQVQ